jgi:LPXTG-motif cell wall-anchored protein
MHRTFLFLTAFMLIPPAQAIAQSNDKGEVDVGDTHQSQGNSKLGLLGLLGLAGLLGLKRKEPDIHVDARGEKRG